MHRSGPPKPKSLGYLAISHDDQGRSYGGLLVIDRLGRPIEFHCTAPVDPSAAHRQLYGLSLRREVVAGQIAPALLRHVKNPLACVVTDCVELFESRADFKVPVVLVVSAGGTPRFAKAGDSDHQRIKAARIGSDDRAWVHADFAADEAEFARTWSGYAEHVELREPLQRIHGALEAARQAKAA